MRIAIAFAVIGYLLIVAGFTMAWRPLGPISAGAMLTAAAIKYSRKSE